MKTDITTLTKTDCADYTLIRSKRRTLGIEVRPGGAVIVRAPLKLPETEIRAFVASKSDWIAKARAKLAARQAGFESYPKPTESALSDGDTLPYMGGELIISHRNGISEPRAEGGTLFLPLETNKDALVKWLRGRAADELNPRIGKYAELIGVGYKSVRLSDARTRWGMCSGKDTVNLSWRLIFCPPEAMDYVVAHELCHVRHKNHGADFHAELERVVPQAKQIEKWFKKNSNLIRVL